MLGLGLVAVAAWLSGCGDGDSPGDGGAADSAVIAPDAGGDARVDAGADAGPGSDVAPGGDADPDAPPAMTGFYPCDVEAVMKVKCFLCHTSPPQMGAPMSLLTYQATQALIDSGTGRMWQRMKRYIEIDFMPLDTSPNGPLAPGQKQLMLTWLGQGAPAAVQACATGADAGGN